MTRLWRSLAVFAMVFVSTACPVRGATAGQLFVGDFETGNFAQWSMCQAISVGSIPCSSIQPNYSMQVEDAFVRQGKYAARFEVRQGDQPAGMCCGDRSEVAGFDFAAANEGDEFWYQWSSSFAEGFPASDGWYGIAQWHAKRDGVPPVSIGSTGDGRWSLFIQTWDNPQSEGPLLRLWNAPVVVGVWNDLKLHIKWSESDALGFIEMWVNGVQQAFVDSPCVGQSHCSVRTLMPGGGGVYFKQGYYRDGSTASNGVVFHDGFSVARDESDLQPL